MEAVKACLIKAAVCASDVLRGAFLQGPIRLLQLPCLGRGEWLQGLIPKQSCREPGL